MKTIVDALKSRLWNTKSFLSGNLTFPQFAWTMLTGPLRWDLKSDAKLFGKPFKVPNKDFAGFVALTREVIAMDQYHSELIPKNACVVDAGANSGTFSVFVGATRPDVTIYAFEPSPMNFACLKENTKFYPNVKIFNHALGSKEGTAEIVEFPDHGGGNYLQGRGANLSPADIKPARSSRVDVKTIDSFNLPMGFLKIDTEGCEADVIRGASKTIAERRPIVSVSAYHRPEDKVELPKILNSMTPYHCELRRDCEEDLICKPL